MFKLTLELIRTIETTRPFIFQLWEEEFILVQVSGGWISWNYNQLSQAKAEAEPEFGNIH